MVNQDEFRRQVRDALHHLYDYPYLEDHPLAVQYWPEVRRQGPRRAHQLSRILLESIEELNPPGTTAIDTSRTRFYSLLVSRYVDEQPLDGILREMGLSRSQFFREQQKAISLLASTLRERLPEQPPALQAVSLLDAEADRLLVQREAVDPVEVVEGVLAVVRHLAERQSVALLHDADPELPPIHGSRTLLRQALLKALSDLIAWPGAREVRVDMRREGRRLAVALVARLASLTGQPGEAARQTVPEWELVRRLVEMMGGHWQGPRQTPAEIGCAFDLPTDSSRVLLVIDDNEGIGYAFQGYVASYGYEVVGTRTGVEAVSLARQLGPAAITLDIMMPTQDGWEILQVLKDDPSTRAIPVIICSVLEDPQLARSLGAADYLQKPVSQADLLGALDRLAEPIP